jgi:GNAT superfamily N-acetyltransferase
MTPTFRLATQADAAELSRFGAAVFTDWYLPDNTAEDVHLHVRETYTPQRQSEELAEIGQWAVLAHIGTELAGYGLLRADRPCPGMDIPQMAEIRRFYVSRAWHGQGIAGSLMHAVIEHGESVGARGFWLTCWEKNPRALAFYAKCGFIRVGDTTFTVGTDVQTDHLLARCR